MPRSRSRLFRRPGSPFWYAVWTDGAGHHHRQSTGCRDHGAAARWLAARELERASAEAGVPVARAVPLLQALAEYLDEREPEWSRGWFQAVDGFVRLRVLPHFGEARAASTVTRADVQRFRSGEIGRLGRGGRPVSNASVNRLLAALAAFGRWCLVEGRAYHTSNPWSGHPPLPEDQVALPEVDGEQLAAILGCLSDRWRPVVEFALETGLRKSELSRLRWEDVRTAERVAFVVSSGARGRTKSRKLRAQALSLRAVEILETLPRREDGAVFGVVGDPRRAFARAAKTVGLERVWLHLFRHLSTSRLAALGAGRHDLREWGGWSSTRMVDRYLHGDHRRLLDLLDRSAEGPTPSPLPPGKPTGGPE